MESTGGPNDSVESPLARPPPEDARLKDSSVSPRGLTAPPEYIPAPTKFPSGQDYTANLLSLPPSLSGDSKTLSKTPGKSSMVSHRRRLTTDTTFFVYRL